MRRLEKGVAEVGSRKEQFSKTEKWFQVSKVGARIFSRIPNIMS